MTTRLAVGLMSGTSADGVDAALAEFEGTVPDLTLVRVVAAETVPFGAELRDEVLACVRPETSDVEKLCLLNVRLGEVMAKAAGQVMEEAGVKPGDVTVIGSHGQTVWHAPHQNATLQIGEPAVIAERTGVRVVADFRPADVAAGGQGAPLVPFVDWVLLRHPEKSRAIQNIGGIANVTYLPAGAELEQVLALDTGPGNMIVDELVRRHTGGNETFDADGRLAREGSIDPGELERLLAHPFLSQSPPKSTGRETFGRAFVDRWVLGSDLSMLDRIATATAFTAASIARAYRDWLPKPVDEMYVCGGGAENGYVMQRLADELPDIAIDRTDAVGLPSDMKEAIAFAVLALATLDGEPSNVPAVTGASGARVLGKICAPATEVAG